MWTGENRGERSLILPNEEAVRVFLRVYFLSEVDCKYNGTLVRNHTIFPVSLDFNQTYTLGFESSDGLTLFIFNVYTDTEENYAAEEIFDINRATYLNDVQNSWILGAVSVGLGIFTGYHIKRLSRERGHDRES